MKLFIHARITLEYVNFEKENKFKSFLSIFIASAITAGVNEIDPHMNRHDHSCKGSLDL